MRSKIFTLAMLMLLCSGCQQVNQRRAHYVRDFSQDYRTASLGPALIMPEGLVMPMPTENYPLPAEIPLPGSVNPPSLIPPGFNIS